MTQRVDLDAFLARLFTDGCVEVDCATGFAAPSAVAEQIAPRLRQADALARRELPGPAPALALDVAVHAACLLHAGCVALQCRDLDAALIARALRRPAPAAAPAGAAHSADLTLRYLPDLVAMARKRAPNDPLVEDLLHVARAWPLSSVGVGDLGDLDLAPLFADRALTLRYVDRILAARDATRLRDARVRAAVRVALGAHPDLEPWAATTLDILEKAAEFP